VAQTAYRTSHLKNVLYTGTGEKQGKNVKNTITADDNRQTNSTQAQNLPLERPIRESDTTNA
jgi:hypothetical protein